MLEGSQTHEGGIDTIGTAFYTVADGDGQTAEAPGSVLAHLSDVVRIPGDRAVFILPSRVGGIRPPPGND
jgi:hypothetical protein